MDEVNIKKYPAGVVLGALSRQVFDCLARYTSFPWPILTAQCKRCQLDPASLNAQELKKVLPFLVDGLARFTSPQKGEQLNKDLSALLQYSK